MTLAILLVVLCGDKARSQEGLQDGCNALCKGLINHFRSPRATEALLYRSLLKTPLSIIQNSHCPDVNLRILSFKNASSRNPLENQDVITVDFTSESTKADRNQLSRPRTGEEEVYANVG